MNIEVVFMRRFQQLKLRKLKLENEEFQAIQKSGLPWDPYFWWTPFRCNRDHTFWRLIPAISEPRDMEKI